LKALRSIN